jgi:hypothetical protein
MLSVRVPRLSLTIIDHVASAASPPDSEVVVRAPDGRAVGYGWKNGSETLLKVPGIAVYSLKERECEVVATADHLATPTPDDIRETFEKLALPLFLQSAFGFEAFHASAVHVPNAGVVAFCGVSGTGKSTIAYGLAARGFEPWADDAVVLKVAADAIRCVSLPFALTLRTPASAHFGSRAGPPLLGRHSRHDPKTLALGAVVVLRPSTDVRAAQIDTVRAADVLMTLLPHAFCFRPSPNERMRELMSNYLELASRVPVLLARFAPSLARLEGLLDAIERELAVLERRSTHSQTS